MRLDRKLSVYEGLIENIKRDISLGILSGGEKLPSCRELALKLGINPNTVQRAYSELEAQGIIYTIPKKGAYVCDKTEPAAHDGIREAIAAMKKNGVPKGEIIKILEEVYGDTN